MNSAIERGKRVTTVRNAQAKLVQQESSYKAVRQFLDAIMEEIADLTDQAEVNAIEEAAELIMEVERNNCRVHVTGVGKPEHAARYAASLLSSTGTSTYFLHATECRHGSAGQVRPGDVVIAISNSGQTSELLDAVKIVKKLGARIIAVTGDSGSPLARLSDLFLFAGVKSECDPLDMAPRASFIGQTLVISALSVSLQTRKGLTHEQYALWHPSGALGRKARERNGHNGNDQSD
ncbi:MAG TPA: SIS domain-containing protein [Blastocatellia bacterium]|nr:SIS domain-containing protein [Blastocatellia bacterium]